MSPNSPTRSVLVGVAIAVLIGVFASSEACAQTATWKGQHYSGRVCSNPNCGMCASIQRQIESQRAQSQRLTFQPSFQTVTDTPLTPHQQAFQTVTTMEPRSRQVKRCDGVRCWYETVTEMVPVTRQVPIATPAKQPIAAPKTQAKPVPAADMLAVTELMPTPQAVVVAMLSELCPSNKAKLFDLGCGDGRIVITAAKQFGCTAVGIELNPETIALARANALAEYVNPLVVLFEGDVRAYDLQPAQYVTMYLYPELMAAVMPKIKPGTQIASYQHEIPGVTNAEHTVDVDGQTHVFYTGIKP